MWINSRDLCRRWKGMSPEQRKQVEEIRVHQVEEKKVRFSLVFILVDFHVYLLSYYSCVYLSIYFYFLKPFFFLSLHHFHYHSLLTISRDHHVLHCYLNSLSPSLTFSIFSITPFIFTMTERVTILTPLH